jgi:hypothetical protein
MLEKVVYVPLSRPEKHQPMLVRAPGMRVTDTFFLSQSFGVSLMVSSMGPCVYDKSHFLFVNRQTDHDGSVNQPRPLRMASIAA